MSQVRRTVRQVRQKFFSSYLKLSVMNESRDQMNAALKNIAVPVLRNIGFKGTFPHFYRANDNHIDLLKFQFRMSGGSFVVELSYADKERNNIYIDKDAPPSRLRTDQTSKRLRLGAERPGEDYWFNFEKTGFLKRKPNYDGIAEDVVGLLRSQGEEWWYAQKTCR